MLVNIIGCKERQAGKGGGKKSKEWGWNLRMNGATGRESPEGPLEAR